MVRADTIPVYMLTWYKFHYGLNLMRPPVARRCCIPTVSGKPPKPPHPTTQASIRVAIHPSRLRLAIFLYIRFPRFSVVLLLSAGPLSVACSQHRDFSTCCALCCALRFKILYPIVENKVLRVDSSHSEAVWRLFDKK